jgi:hypothetical protein
MKTLILCFFIKRGKGAEEGGGQSKQRYRYCHHFYNTFCILIQFNPIQGGVRRGRKGEIKEEFRRDKERGYRRGRKGEIKEELGRARERG